jgi:hypothetical protein
VTARELTEWTAFERVCGPLLVQDRVDHMSAAVLAGLAGSSGAKHVNLEDFLPQWDTPAEKPERKEQSPEQMIDFMRNLQARRKKNT